MGGGDPRERSQKPVMAIPLRPSWTNTWKGLGELTRESELWWAWVRRPGPLD
jgi:hypothetical protein